MDDAFALLLVFQSPSLEIAGLSSSYGNAPLATTDRVARRLARDFATPPLPVHTGARKADDLGRPTAATQALASALRQRRLTYVALGPLTNLATFQMRHPRLARRIDRVVFVGGERAADSLRFGRDGWLKIHDANVVKDPAAVRALLASEIPITLAPAEVGARLMLTPPEMRTLAQAGEGGRFLARRTQFWLPFWRHLVGREGGPLFDALAILAASDPALVETKSSFARLDGHLLISDRAKPDARPVRVVSGFKPKARTEMLRRLARSPVSKSRTTR